MAASRLYGYAGESVADFCPDALELIEQQFNKPDIVWRGVSLHSRAATLGILGICLSRQAVTKPDSASAARIKTMLLRGLADVDPAVRTVAINALALVSSDPEVQSRLQKAASEDSLVKPVPGHPELPGRYQNREAAIKALQGQSNPRLQNVTRTSDMKECRVQALSETPAGEIFIGPVEDATRQMCRHMDDTRRDPSLCWRVSRADACVRLRD